MRDEVSSYLELAVDYGSFGAWDEALGVLDRLIRSGNERASSYPLLYYYAALRVAEEGRDGGRGPVLQAAPRRCLPTTASPSSWR